MTKEIRQRLTDLKTRIALEGAILMLYEGWFSILEHFDGVAYSNEDISLVANIPVGLVRLLKEVRNSVEGDFQDRAMALYDLIHVEDDQDNPRRYSHFAQYEKGVIDRWMQRKLKEEKWSKQQISKEQAISDFCHVFHMTFGTDIEVREVENPEEIDKTFTDRRESTEELESQMRFLVRLARAGGVDLRQAYLVMNEEGADFADYDNFLRVFDVWAEKEEQQHDDSDD